MIVADRTYSLLELIAFCFEKNEILFGGSLRHCPYETPVLAHAQYERLVREAMQYFAPDAPSAMPFGLHWPGRLAIVHKGCAVMVFIAARRDGPAWKWSSDPDWTRVEASDDWRDLFDAVERIFR